MPTRAFLSDFELIVLLAVMRVGEDAYGVPVARENRGDDRPHGGCRGDLRDPSATGRQRSRVVRVGRSNGRAWRARQALLSRDREGDQGRPRGATRVRRVVAGCSTARRRCQVTASNPPRLAAALLRWMGPRDEAVIGDLLEQYRTGRSTWWWPSWKMRRRSRPRGLEQLLAVGWSGTSIARRARPWCLRTA